MIHTQSAADSIAVRRSLARFSGRVSAVIETIDFHGLTRSVQERFVACVNGVQEPKPIVADKIRSRAPMAWLSVVVIANVMFAAYVGTGFGDPHSTHAMHRGASLAIYALFIAAIALAIAKLVVLRVRTNALPFDRGIYVFPLSVVDAREATIRLYYLADLLHVEVDPRDPRGVKLVFSTGEVVALHVDDDAAAAAARIEAARVEARELRGAGNPRITMMFTLDPLQRSRASSPLKPRKGLGRNIPSWTRLAWIAAPVASILAVPLAHAHDAASDARMYRVVVAANDAPSYRAYLARGGSNSPFVASVLLPRAELREAEQKGTVEAIDDYIATHPNSAIASEVRAARKNALLAELETAKKVGTVPALQDFAKKRPDSGLEPELRAAIHGLFVPALDAYHKLPPPNAHVSAFVDRLFTWSEAKAHAGTAATTIQIRFRRKLSNTMRRADKMVADHHWFIGDVSYPSHYFDATHAIPRETALADAVGKEVRGAFGPNVFTVEQGPRLEDGDGPLPAVTEPTLFITHSEVWPGPFDGSITKPRGVWICVTYRFSTTFVIPGDSEPLTFELEVPEKIPQSVIEQNPMGGTPQSPLEDKIYGSMSTSAFDSFRDKYLTTLLPAKH